MSNNKEPNCLCSENGLEINSMWSRVIMNFEMWIMYVSWNLPTSPVLSLSRFSSNVKTISAAETEISTASTARSWRKIALILLLRHFWTLNFSSLKQRKGSNIYKLTQTWNSECSSYKYSMWQRTNVRTLRVCLQQRSSKVTWNYTWNLTLRRWIWRGGLTDGFLHYRFGGLIFGRAYTWRGLFSEFYGMYFQLQQITHPN